MIITHKHTYKTNEKKKQQQPKALLTIHPAYLFAGHTNGRPFLQKARMDNDTHDNGVSAVEDILGHDLQLAWEHCHMLELLLFLFQQVITVLCKLVKQVIDDISCEDGDPRAVSKFLDVSFDFYIKGKDDCISGEKKSVSKISREHSPVYHVMMYYFMTCLTALA